MRPPLKFRKGDLFVNQATQDTYKVTDLQGNRVWCRKLGSLESDGYFHITHIMAYIQDDTYKYFGKNHLPEELFTL